MIVARASCLYCEAYNACFYCNFQSETAHKLGGSKLTVERVLPPYHQGEFEGVAAISRVDSDSIDVWADV